MKNIKKQHNIYKTTNLVNGRFYWGVHNSIDENDGYLGGGTILRKAIKKHGKENFKRKTMVAYETAADAYFDEGLIVNQAMVDDPMCYNVHLGGRGGSLPGIYSGMYGKRHSIEFKQKQSKLMKERWNDKIYRKKVCSSFKERLKNKENNPMFGKHHSEESKAVMSAMKVGKHHSEESKAKMSESLKERFKNKENHPAYGKKRPDISIMNKKRAGQNHPMSLTNRARRQEQKEKKKR